MKDTSSAETWLDEDTFISKGEIYVVKPDCTVEALNSGSSTLRAQIYPLVTVPQRFEHPDILVAGRYHLPARFAGQGRLRRS